MNLYYITAPFPGDGCMENFNLWVRADNEHDAFSWWVRYYALHEGGPNNEEPEDAVYERPQAEEDYEYEIVLKKTYPADTPHIDGAITWDDVRARTLGTL